MQINRYLLLSITIGIVFSLLYLGNTIYFKKYLINGSDRHYYIAVADSLIKDGIWADRTTIPSGPILTPQNGIIIIYAFLRKLGLSCEQTLIVNLFLSYFLWIFSAVGYWEILKLFKIGTLCKYFLIAGFIGTGHLLRVVFDLGVDCPFMCLSIWFNYLLFKYFLEDTANKLIEKSLTPQIKHWGLICLIAVIMVHFRINGFVWIIATILTLLLSKKYIQNRAEKIIFFLVVLVVSAASLLLIMMKIGSQQIASSSSAFFSDFFNNLLELNVPGFVLSDYMLQGLSKYPAAVFTICFMLFLMYSFFLSWKQQNNCMLFICFSLLGSFLFAMMIPNNFVLVAASRYIMATLPFFWILLSRINILQYLLYPLIVLGFIRTVYISCLAGDSYFNRPSQFMIYLNKEHIKLPEGYHLLSNQPRNMYTILGARSYKQIEDIVETGGKNIWIVGGEYYRRKQLSNIARLYNIRGLSYSDILNQKNIPEGFNITEVKIK